MHMKLLKLLIALLLPFLFFTQAAYAQSFPKPVGYVNDFAGLYSESFRTTLEQKLASFESSNSAEVTVVTVDTLGDSTIEDYASKLFEDWKIGKAIKDNGVLLLIAEKEHDVRIEVGYGLEPVVTDARAGRIIRNDIIPEFKAGNYEAGTEKGVATLLSYIRGESVPEVSKPTQDWSGWLDFIPFIFFGFIYVGSFLARTKDYYVGGILGLIIGLIIGIFVGQLMAIFYLTVVLGLLGLALDYILSRNYQALKLQHKDTGWWGSRGGFSGGGGRSGGFGGGFGGGSSGGGGASGHW